MILNELYFFKKKEHLIGNLITIFIFMVFLATFIFAFTISDNLKIGHFKIFSLILRAFFGVLCAISILDIMQMCQNHKCVGLKIVRYLKYKRKNAKPLIVAPTCNDIQKNVCEGIFENEKLSSLIHIYGFADRGKTTTALFMLEGLFLYGSEKTIKKRKIIFIDCSIDQQEILDFFRDTWRPEKFKDAIIILDHIEKMGSYFLKTNQELFNNGSNLFVLIEDSNNKNGDSALENYISEEAKPFNLNDNIVNESVYPINVDAIRQWDKGLQTVFFVIYLLVQSRKYVEVTALCEIQKISKRKLRKYIKKINEIKVFALFPFNHNYIYCVDNFKLKQIHGYFKDTDTYNLCINSCIRSSSISSEEKWICFIHYNINKIKKQETTQRVILFNKVIYKGRFSRLYSILANVIKAEPQKEKVLFYEYGVLSYYNGLHKQAFKLFKMYLQTWDKEDQLFALLRIIESAHGSSDSEVMRELQGYIKVLQKSDSLFCLYAEYWKLHIETEKGIFNLEKMTFVSKALLNQADTNNSHIHTEILKRSFTDILRCHHILEKCPSPELIKKFEDFLLIIDYNIYEYYSNLYIIANTIHYNDIPLLVRKHNNNKDLHELIVKARNAYEKALCSGYLDEKSRKAVRVKRAELEMITEGANFSESLKIVDDFLVHAQMNEVDVHEGFAHTMLAKFLMVSNDRHLGLEGQLIPIHIEREIEEHLYIAQNKFKKYNNEYGVLRIDFLKGLFKLYQLKTPYIEELNSFKKLIQRFSAYRRETKIGEEICERVINNTLSKYYLQSVIKTYPIILQ